MQDSDRLDSDALNPMPSDLAAQIELHRNPEGELVSVPSDLARQIEEHKKETKVRVVPSVAEDLFSPGVGLIHRDRSLIRLDLLQMCHVEPYV